MTELRSEVVVVGGGVAGLVAALECARLGLSVTVLERAATAGGCVGRIELAGLTLDSGAESFATRGGGVAELIEHVGLEGDIVKPNPAGAWLAMPGPKGGVVAAPLPKTGMLGIPANPLGDDVRAIIGWGGAVRAYADRLTPILRIGRARSLGDLVRTRMGRKVLDRLVTPISSGVYSANPDDLDLDVVAPGLNEAMTRAGSLSGGVAELVETRRAGSAVLGLRGGMHRLVDALLAELDRFGATVITSAEVVGLERRAGSPGSPETRGASGAAGVSETRGASGTPGPSGSPGWRARALVRAAATGSAADGAHAGARAGTGAGAAEGAAARTAADGAAGGAAEADVELVVEAAYAIVATPAHAARPLLATSVDGWADVPDAPDAASVELVTLVLDAPALAAAPRGTGVLVAADTPGVAAKALTHSSAKWAWVAETAAPHQVVRLSYGRLGGANPLDGRSDADVAELAVADASALTGVPLDRSMLVDSGRTPWRDALSHAALGQRDRVRAVEEAVAAVPGLEVTGSWLSGTGLASVVPHAKEAASRVRHLAVRARAGGETGTSA
ncbi:protoporphyrinogen/coproporphyrinogen oxidase [Agromyces aerolatus]|uniref:protoporphyrinogen/coproporphyrinogen oxidase n=1 Tax=Agromyces sp. LY-1074 TaxID=3074080 RepID=UPI002854C03B|nr:MULTISPECIES: FAD-dependent oxidoreductase [unclassified Agromyces]MDR5701632.1 FAD-dependent oxidoreductase [Agromyces sp. LY-1074]MDR5707928.1 FAD-dependent oxidoreductase [Agromyces sp. LY-1358]